MVNEMVDNIRKSQTLTAEVRSWIADLKQIEITYRNYMKKIEGFIQHILNNEKMDSDTLKEFDDQMYEFGLVFNDLETLFEDIGGIEREKLIDIVPLLEKIQQAKKFLLETVKIYIKDYFKSNRSSNDKVINQIIKNDVINMRTDYANLFFAIQNTIIETRNNLESNILKMRKI